MPTYITVDRGDGTSFVGVSDGSITQEGSGTGALIVFPGSGWVLVSGTGVKVRSGYVEGHASGSQILMQNFPPSDPSRPSTSRVLVLQATNGGTVAALDGGVQRALTAGQYVDVINSDPVKIGLPQQYVASAMPDTAAAVEDAQEALEAEDPES